MNQASMFLYVCHTLSSFPIASHAAYALQLDQNAGKTIVRDFRRIWNTTQYCQPSQSRHLDVIPTAKAKTFQLITCLRSLDHVSPLSHAHAIPTPATLSFAHLNSHTAPPHQNDPYPSISDELILLLVIFRCRRSLHCPPRHLHRPIQGLILLQDLPVPRPDHALE